MVLVTASSSNADCGGPSRGSAVSVQWAVLGVKSDSGSQMLCHRYLGLILCTLPLVLYCRTGSLSVTTPSAPFANVFVVAVLFSKTTSSFDVKPSADIFLGGAPFVRSTS